MAEKVTKHTDIITLSKEMLKKTTLKDVAILAKEMEPFLSRRTRYGPILRVVAQAAEEPTRLNVLRIFLTLGDILDDARMERKELERLAKRKFW